MRETSNWLYFTLASYRLPKIIHDEISMSACRKIAVPYDVIVGLSILSSITEKEFVASSIK